MQNTGKLVMDHTDIGLYKPLFFKKMIEGFVADNPDCGVQMLAQLMIDNTDILPVPSDINFQQIKYFLDDLSYKFIVKKAMMEEISIKTVILDRFDPAYSIPQILAWVFKQKNHFLPSLKLEHNELYRLTLEQWRAFFAGLKGCDIASLNLSRNEFNRWAPEQWKWFFAALKDSGIASVDLDCNDLNSLIHEQWTAFCAGLKESGITSLGLTWNELNLLAPEQWTVFFGGLKDSDIGFLDLSKNDLHSLTSEQWRAFCDGLSFSGIVKVNIGLTLISPVNIQQLKEIIQNNFVKLGLRETGLQNLCAFSFWKTPGAKIETFKNPVDSEQYLCVYDGIDKPVDVSGEINQFLRAKGEELKTFGLS